MKGFLTPPLRHVVLCLAALPVTAMAQAVDQCAPITGTMQVQAPGSGTVTVSDLTKYGLPAQVCTKMNITPTDVDFQYTVTEATTYQNATFPSSCAGIPYTLNGGPAYAAVQGSGKFSFASLTSGVTGTMDASALSITENLTLTAACNSFVINTGLLQFKTYITLNADESVDIRVCTPKGGVPATVNGSAFTIPNNIWQCLAAPPVESQEKVRITYDENC